MVGTSWSFVDESGDLGPPCGRGSDYLVVSVLSVQDPMRLARISRKARRAIGGIGRASELKFNSSSDRVRKVVLKKVAEIDCAIAWCAIDKRSFPLDSRADKGYAYRTAVVRALRPIASGVMCQQVQVIIDKRNEKWHSRSGTPMAVKDLFALSTPGIFPPEVRVGFLDSQRVPGIQITDFVSGAVFQMLERGRPEFYRLIEHMVTEGTVIR